MQERIDIHFHLLGKDDDFEAAEKGRALYWSPGDNQHWQTWITNGYVEGMLRLYQHDLGLHGKLTTEQYAEIAYRSLASSTEIDAIVLLALDAVFTEDHTIDRVKTDLWVPNDYLAERTSKLNARFSQENLAKRFYLGASVHPYREDWQDRLEQALQLKAVLLKIIPSVQIVDFAKVAPAFWTAVAASKLPLLVHVGAEYAFPEGRRNPELDHIDQIKFPLDQGVKVIVAHCGSRVFPVDPDYVDELVQLMKRYNTGGDIRLWADTSALLMASRVAVVKRIKKLIPSEFLVHGSDFPVPVDPFAYNPLDFPEMTLKTFVKISETNNHLDQDVLIKRAIGFPDTILTAASQVLRLDAKDGPA
jgi:uncharacterized protein